MELEGLLSSPDTLRYLYIYNYAHPTGLAQLQGST